MARPSYRATMKSLLFLLKWPFCFVFLYLKNKLLHLLFKTVLLHKIGHSPLFPSLSHHFESRDWRHLVRPPCLRTLTDCVVELRDRLLVIICHNTTRRVCINHPFRYQIF